MSIEEMVEELSDIKRKIAIMQDNGIEDDEDIDWGRIYERFESAYCELEEIKDYLREIQYERENKGENK